MRGHVRKRGKKWCFVIPIDGKPKWFSGFDKKSDAEKRMAEVINDINKGVFTEPSKLTFKEYVEKEYLPTFKKRVSPYTFCRYSSMIKHRILPLLGAVQIAKIRPSHIKSFLLKISEGGRKDGKEGQLSYRTIGDHKKVIYGILQTAVLDEIITKNPAKNVPLPIPNEAEIMEKRKRVKVWTRRQVNIMEEELKNAPYPYQEAIYIALRCALRRGELLGIRWCDIDFKNRTIMINQTLAYVPGYGMFIKEVPKNKASLNSIEVSGKVISVLRSLQKKQAEYKLFFGPDYNTEFKDLVFSREKGRPVYPDTLSIWFPKFLAKIKLPPLNFHCLRHTCASLMVESGATIGEVSRYLRHSSIDITEQIYWHLFPGQQRKVAEKLDSFIEETKGTP